MQKPRLFTYILNGLILLALVFAAWKYLNAEAIGEALERLNLSFVPVLLLLALFYILLKTWRFALATGAVADIPFMKVAKAYLASQPITLLPGGIASRTLFLHEAGAPLGTAIVPTLMVSLLDQVVFVLALFLAAFMFDGAKTPAYIVLVVIALLIALFSFPATRQLIVGLLHKVSRKYQVTEHLKDFSKALETATEPYRLASLFALTLADFFLTVLILDISLQAVGAEISYSVLFLAYILPTMAGRFTVLPGGVGLTEAGMLGTLISLGHLDINQAAAGIVIFRIVSVLLQSLLGGLVYFISWKPFFKKT